MKKLTALLLTVALCLGCCGLTATALYKEPGISTKDTYIGSCGDNLTWTLDTETGVLDITGTGDIAYYSSSYDFPWYDYRSSITTVNIADGFTSIGDYAFAHCTSLVNITIPDGVTSIGDSAFFWCKSLTSITIPDSVTSIDGGAFYCCESLVSITIPDGVTSIGDSAFYRCESLTSITIPDSVTSIDVGAFFGCKSLETVYYMGSEDEWNAISIYEGNSYLTSANIVFNYVPEEPDTSESESTPAEDDTPESDVLFGDVNGDGVINSLDAAQILKFDAMMIELDENALKAADVNGDGGVDSLDAAQILKFDAMLIDKFPVEQ